MKTMPREAIKLPGMAETAKAARWLPEYITSV